MNPLQKKWKSRRRFVFLCSEIVSYIAISKLKTWKHIIWQHEQHESHTIIHKCIRTLACLKGVMLSVQENKHQAHFRSLLKLLYHVISTFEIMKNYIMLPACSNTLFTDLSDAFTISLSLLPCHAEIWNQH
jgi:hypothetical protein